MKHIKTLTTRDLKESMKKGGCGECQTSCQSACKTSCTVGNQSCEKARSVLRRQKAVKMIGYSGRLDMRRMTGLHCGIRVTDKEKNL